MYELFEGEHENLISCAILMPKYKVLRIWNSCHDMITVAEFFRVPVRMVYARLDFLGLLDEDEIVSFK